MQRHLPILTIPVGPDLCIGADEFQELSGYGKGRG
jgi:hypothetical protein